MSVRNLGALLEPASIALIGAGRESDPTGRVLARNLLGAGFAGPITALDPDVRKIQGLPRVPDLAVIASPPPEVPALVAALAARGTRAAVITSSFAGQGRSAKLQQAILDAAKPTCMRILGPGCLGLMVPGHGLNVSFAERPPVAGNLALIAQSGGVLNSVLDWAGSRNIGFSHLIATGDMADVDVGDLLDYLAMDRHTRAILLHLEALSEARKFLSAARAAARARSVVVIKAGRYPEAVRPPRRPDAPVGADAVYRAAFRRAGMLEIETLDEVFDAVESLATDLDVAGDRLAIVSDSAGMAVLALDALLAGGGRPAALAPETIGKLDRVLPAHWSGKNPVDLIGDAPGERYGQALDAVLADSGNDAVLVVRCPSALADGLDAAEATVAAARRHRRPLLTSWVGETAAAGARKLFDQEYIATYATPGEAVRAFVHLACYRRNQAILLEAPPSIPESFSPEPEVAERIIDAALAEDREELAPCETDALLAAYDLSIAGTAPEGRRATILAAEDPLFGPVIRLDVEGRDEQALGLPPLNLALAYDLLRDAAPAGPKGDLALILVKVSQLICDLDRVVGLELDLALSTGTVLVRSARARIASRRTGATRLAIRPYPKELEQPLVLRDGRTLLLRPIRPEDAPAFRHMVENRTAQEDRRLRFFSAIKTLTPQLCARLTQIDYDREMALVAIDPAAGVQDAFCGVVRITADPDRERAEYAVLVRSDLKGQGLGRRLMEAMIGYARAQGLDEIFGEVLRENTPMLRLAEALGFGRDPVPDAPELVVVRLRL